MLEKLLREKLGAEKFLEELLKAMSEEEKQENCEWIARMYGYEEEEEEM